MGEDQSEKIKQDLVQIADMLLLNGTLMECPGLVQGKMGIAIFFFHYAKYTGNELFADYAMDLIGEMLNQIITVQTISKK
jgi:lantibiotic modifying enzyme